MAEIQGKGGKGVRIDMTPMVDLGFLLLTFFIMTTTFSKPQTMEINMPVKTDNQEEQMAIKASNAMTILLGSDNRVFYYLGLNEGNGNVNIVETDWSANGLRRQLLAAKANPNMVVMIKADETAAYKNMVDALDEMAITDTKKYAIVELDNADATLLRNKLEGK